MEPCNTCSAYLVHDYIDTDWWHTSVSGYIYFMHIFTRQWLKGCEMNVGQDWGYEHSSRLRTHKQQKATKITEYCSVKQKACSCSGSNSSSSHSYSSFCTTKDDREHVCHTWYLSICFIKQIAIALNFIFQPLVWRLICIICIVIHQPSMWLNSNVVELCR